MAGGSSLGRPASAPPQSPGQVCDLVPTLLDPDDDPQVWVVDNGQLRLAFLPGVGGRLLSLRALGREWLWINPEYFSPELAVRRPRGQWAPLDGTMGSWANVGGSKTWPAPQGWEGPGQWAGPPDPVLDAGGWAWEWEAWVGDGEEGVMVRLTSPDDARSGLRVTREFAIPATGCCFVETATFTNVSRGPITWSIWEVCQVDTADGAGREVEEACVEVGVADGSAAPGATPVVLAQAVGRIEVGPTQAAVTCQAVPGTRTTESKMPRRGVGDRGRSGDLVRRIPIRDVVAKVGLPDADRFIAYRAPSGERLAIAFEAVDEGLYPDGGSRAEVWMQCPLAEPLAEFEGLHPRAYLAELEVLSPAARLEPGASTSLTLRWSVSR